MAYTKLRDCLSLATDLQASSVGLTIQQMMQRTERSRRSVYRMIDGLYELGLKAKESSIEEDHHLTKRWRLDGVPSALLALEPTERSSLERHLQTLKEGSEKIALSKLLADQQPLSKHLAIDQEVLIEREAHIEKVGPRSAIDKTLIATLERAIKGCEELNLSYRAQGKPKASTRTVRPLGMLFGRFSYLVGSTGNRAPISYRMDLIEKAELAGSYFEPRKNWNFKEWASESFGVYHGDAFIEIKLRFKKDVAKRAEKVSFHPSQRTEKGREGSLVVYLRCRGHQELFAELCHPDWVGNVVIEEPDGLKVEYKRYLLRLQKALKRVKG